MTTESELNYCVEQALEVAKNCGLKYGSIKEIKVNDRLSRALGRCCERGTSENPWYRLEFNPEMLRKCNYNFIMSTILHEIIHTCDGCYNHGANFKAAGRKVMAKYPQYKISTTSDPYENCVAGLHYSGGKYAVKCDKCGTVIYKNRMRNIIKYPNTYVHKLDGGRFQRVK